MKMAHAEKCPQCDGTGWVHPQPGDHKVGPNGEDLIFMKLAGTEPPEAEDDDGDGDGAMPHKVLVALDHATEGRVPEDAAT
jgi:hypothetical protein